jgi:hypothetical protein
MMKTRESPSRQRSEKRTFFGPPRQMWLCEGDRVDKLVVDTV